MFSKKRLFFGLVIFAFLTLDLGAGFCNEPCKECIASNFKRQDLVNLTADGKNTFTVTAIFERKGQQIAFEGSDFVYLK